MTGERRDPLCGTRATPALRFIAIRYPKEEFVKRFAIAITLAVALGTVAFASSALARNPHCAGGIQYVVQGLADKDKGNLALTMTQIASEGGLLPKVIKRDSLQIWPAKRREVIVDFSRECPELKADTATQTFCAGNCACSKTIPERTW